MQECGEMSRLQVTYLSAIVAVIMNRCILFWFVCQYHPHYVILYHTYFKYNGLVQINVSMLKLCK